MKSTWSSKHLAELVGTFGLTLAVFTSITASVALATPVVAALTLGIFVYTIGGISGCHINPAVTVGLWSVGKIDQAEALKYMLMQIIGAGLAMWIGGFLTGFMPPFAADSISPTGLDAIAEMIGAAFLVFGVSSVAQGKVGDAAAGLTIGGSLLVGILIASSAGAHGILNPAVAFGLQSFNLMYVGGPLLGGIIGAKLYRALVE